MLPSDTKCVQRCLVVDLVRICDAACTRRETAYDDSGREFLAWERDECTCDVDGVGDVAEDEMGVREVGTDVGLGLFSVDAGARAGKGSYLVAGADVFEYYVAADVAGCAEDYGAD